MIIGISAANHDPLIWGDNVDEWKPERWLGQGLDIASEKLPGVYSGMWVVFSWSIDLSYFSKPRMTFGGGGRACMYVLWITCCTTVHPFLLSQRIQILPSRNEYVRSTFSYDKISDSQLIQRLYYPCSWRNIFSSLPTKRLCGVIVVLQHLQPKEESGIHHICLWKYR